MSTTAKNLGHSEHSRQGALKFGTRWTVFGPCKKTDAKPDAAALAVCPETLKAGGKRLKAQVLRAKASGPVDLAPLLGGTEAEKTAYVYIPITAPRAGEYTIGLGADWWFEAWVDGKKLGDTLGSGNGMFPVSSSDYSYRVSLEEGPHVLCVRFISGSASSTMAAGVPWHSHEQQMEIQRARQLGIAMTVTRPLKVVFLGAGSAFLQPLFTDILQIPGADKGNLALVDVDLKRLDLAEKLCRKVVETTGKDWTVTATADRRKVLKGANYVINCIEVSGTECVAFDNDIPMKYGVDQCIGDTIGPGGLFKALRTVPVFLDVLRDIEKLCPAAWVLNYTNPMSIMCLSASRASRANVVGLCHSVQGASHSLAAWTRVPYDELKWTCAGVNHLAWFTGLSHKGRDLYPLLKKRVLEEKGFDEQDKVRFDLMMHFGYYCTESSGHDSEYLPYYRKRKDLLKTYCRDGYGGGSRFYASNWPAWRKASDQRRRDQISGKKDITLTRSWEYASFIIQAMETHAPFIIYGNMPNRNLISNLPQDGVVEVACLVDRNGVQPIHYGKLAPQCAALCDWNMRFFDMAATACIEKSKTAAAQALMLDPLTAAVCCPAEIKSMTEELFKAERMFLPGFK